MCLDVDGLVDRNDVRERMEEALRNVPVYLRGPDPETWGTSEQEIANLAAAEAMAGGPTTTTRQRERRRPEPDA